MVTTGRSAGSGWRRRRHGTSYRHGAGSVLIVRRAATGGKARPRQEMAIR